jgi:dipeptidyl aminopeptidase/acylaminoacyl peptidase
MKKRITVCIFVLLFLFALTLSAQEPYKQPPKEVLDIINAVPPPRASLSPTGEIMLLYEYKIYPSIDYMSQPLLRIAGTRLLPKYNARQVTTFNIRFTFKNIKDGITIPVKLPKDAKLGNPSWSHDGKNIAFLNYTDNGCELWIAGSATGKARSIKGIQVNATLTSGFQWLRDSRYILVAACLKERGAPPPKPLVPKGPNIQETSGRVAKIRTYQDLLQTAYDKALFDYYTKSQYFEVDTVTGEKRKIASPGIFLGATLSPDGNFYMAYKLKKPYSCLVPYYRFAHNFEIWDKDGNLVHLLAENPVEEEIPISGVATGIRSVTWRKHKPATLVWVEALDDGDPEKKVPYRDKIMTLDAPFKGEPKEISKCKDRFSGITWLKPVGKAFINTRDWKRRWRTSSLVNVDDPSHTPKKFINMSSQDRYNDPGRPVFTRTITGDSIPLQDKSWIYLSGSGSSPGGDRPFLDRMNLKTLKKERLFQSAEKTYQRFIAFSGKNRKQIIISHETKTGPPNYYLYDLKKKKKVKALTIYKDPAPQMTGMKKQRITYKRADGVDLYGTLYLPPDYKEGQRLPCVIWAYPIEFSDPKIAGQVRGSAHRFTFFRGTSQLFYVTQGYAVLDGAQMPVLGDPKTMNDTFVEQIVAAAKAAIDKLDAMGIIDPKRVGVGGHSYGAFMTANLLAHCNLFAAGCARSGAYNRTLTPFGFQSERRTLWQAPELYFKVSPFMHAHTIHAPILLIHGEADNNSGTFPIQSRRLFHALKGHGTTARLVMLPNESHGYRSKESVLHVLAEMIEWFDKYVKDKK